MKKLIPVGIIILLAVAAARIVFKTNDAIGTEVANYVKGLHYKLTARVDSVVVYDERNGKGILYCSVTSGAFDPSVEDSLALHLKEHKHLRILFPTDQGFRMFVADIKKFAPADSVIMDSYNDRFAVFRGSESIQERKVTLSWVGKVSFAFWIPD